MTDLVELPLEIRDSEHLPSPPSVAIEILRVSRDPNSSIEDLVEILSLDPALSARVLALVASPRYRRGREISSVGQAAAVLGMKAITLLALGFSLSADLQTRKDTKFDYDLYWRHSLVTAVSVRRLVRLTKVGAADEAFLCGLLARFGQFVMASALGPDYDKILTANGSNFPTAEIEREEFGYDFHLVARALLSSWGIPDFVCDCVSCWGNEVDFDPSDDSCSTICQFLKIADSLASLICTSQKAESLSRAVSYSEQILGMTGEEVDAFVVSLEDEVRSTAEAFCRTDSASFDVANILNEARIQATTLAMSALADAECVRQENERLIVEQGKLRSEAKTDSLTRLPNRRAFDERLSSVIASRSKGRLADNLGVLILDVDHFKGINDTHGHLVGDAVLSSIAKTLSNATRETDFVARYGGEEFIMILPNTTLPDLKAVAERLRGTIEKTPIHAEGTQLHVTISIGGGCVEWVKSEADAQALLQVADSCLYRSKGMGRNLVNCEVYDPNTNDQESPLGETVAGG